MEMRGSAFSGEGESEDEGRGFGFAGAGELIGFTASWAWAVGMGLEAKWLSAGSISLDWAVGVSGLEDRAV